MAMHDIIIIIRIVAKWSKEYGLILKDVLIALIIVEDKIIKEIKVNIFIILLFFLNIIKFKSSTLFIFLFIPINNNLLIK